MKCGRRARHGRRRAGQENAMASTARKAMDSKARKATRRLSSARLMPRWQTHDRQGPWSHWGARRVWRLGQLGGVRCDSSDAGHQQKGSPACASRGAAKWESAVGPEQRLPTLYVGMRCGWQGIITYMYPYSLSFSLRLSLSRAACLSTL